MKNKTSLTLWASIAMSSLIAQGCASFSTGQEIPGTSNSDLSDVEHVVQKGDRLGDIAKLYTGEVAEWQTIAEYNDITNPHSLSIGDVIKVPRDLIQRPDVSDDKNAEATQNDSLAAAASPTPKANLTATTSNSLGVQRNSNIAEEPAVVVVRPVQVNREFDLKPIDQTKVQTASVSNSAPPQVKVSGTYYPKGLYREPANYASLIMRVAPGTVFELESKVNDWYKVVTEDGIGYLRITDGSIVPNQ